MSKRPAAAPRNRFAARLPRAEYILLTLLPSTRLRGNKVPYEPLGAVEYAYFPGDFVELASFGNERLVGRYSFGGRTSTHRIVVRAGDRAQRVASRGLQGQRTKDRPRKHPLATYHVARMAQVSQSLICNGLHRMGQR